MCCGSSNSADTKENQPILVEQMVNENPQNVQYGGEMAGEQPQGGQGFDGQQPQGGPGFGGQQSHGGAGFGGQ